MPQIMFEGPPMNRAQKAEMVKTLTQAASKITGIQQEAFIVLIKENSPENVGVGGKLLSERWTEQ